MHAKVHTSQKRFLCLSSPVSILKSDLNINSKDLELRYPE